MACGVAFAKLCAAQAAITPESLSRFERGRMVELGARKLLAVLAVLGMELQFTEIGASGSLDELRKERGVVPKFLDAQRPLDAPVPLNENKKTSLLTHRHIIKGLPKPAALRRAQRASVHAGRREGMTGLRDKRVYALGDWAPSKAFEGFSAPPKLENPKALIGRSEGLGKK